jgi:hypothetical protein
MIFLYGYLQKLLDAVGSSQMGVIAPLMIRLFYNLSQKLALILA